MTTKKTRASIQRATGSRRPFSCHVRRELDPTFYPDVFAFRKAVAAGTVDPAKGCRDMDEYLASVSMGKYNIDRASEGVENVGTFQASMPSMAKKQALQESRVRVPCFAVEPPRDRRA